LVSKTSKKQALNRIFNNCPLMKIRVFLFHKGAIISRFWAISLFLHCEQRRIYIFLPGPQIPEDKPGSKTELSCSISYKLHKVKTLVVSY
jgi:hypothetical protein